MCVDDNVQIDLLEGDLIANNFSTPWWSRTLIFVFRKIVPQRNSDWYLTTGRFPRWSWNPSQGLRQPRFFWGDDSPSSFWFEIRSTHSSGKKTVTAISSWQGSRQFNRNIWVSKGWVQ
jgi:hypothetical protein